MVVKVCKHEYRNVLPHKVIRASLIREYDALHESFENLEAADTVINSPCYTFVKFWISYAVAIFIFLRHE